jgi:integrase
MWIPYSEFVVNLQNQKGEFNMQSRPITKGIEAILKFCNDFRSLETIKEYSKACEVILTFYKEHQQASYDADVNNQIRHGLQLLPKERRSIKYCGDRYTFRVLGMLDDYYADHPFKETYPVVSRYKHQLEPFYQDLAEEFRVGLAVKKNTVSMLYSIARDFFYHLQQQQVTDLATIHQEDLYDFLRIEYKDHQGCINNVTYVLRLICEHCRSKGFHNFPLGLMPFSLPPSRSRILPSFERKDMENILAQPDINTSTGKRDYAILMLASYTGIRAIDIANIKLVDINWREMIVNFVQHKTGYGLSLPLVASAAAAVADYILNARPEADSPYIFLTEVAPYRKLNDKSSVANVLNKYVKTSGIEKKEHDGKSFHAFRRSMGIWLLDTASSPEMISQILGHQSKDVLKRYLPLSPTKLSICALGFDGIQVQSEVYR